MHDSGGAVRQPRIFACASLQWQMSLNCQSKLRPHAEASGEQSRVAWAWFMNCITLTRSLISCIWGSALGYRQQPAVIADSCHGLEPAPQPLKVREASGGLLAKLLQTSQNQG